MASATRPTGLLAERLGYWTTMVVVGTAAMLGAGALLWSVRADHEVPIGLLLTLCCGAVGALALAHLGVRRFVLPAGRLGVLARQIRSVTASSELGRVEEVEDPEVNEVIRALNAHLARARNDWAALRQEALLGHSVVEASPDGALVVGADGRIKYMNASFRRMLPVREPPEGRLPIEAIPLPAVHQAVDAVFEKGLLEEIACTFGRADLLVKPIRTEEGGVMILVQDVTRFRNVERARTEFVANVSHELRTPIAAIMGYAETLADERARLDEETAMMADAIARNARRLSDLFEDLLELSRIEARRDQLPVGSVRLQPILEEAVVSAVDLAARRDQDFTLDCEAGLEAVASPEALRTIVANLARNATNYTPEGGHIRVSARPVGQEVVVEVIDDGIGIDRVHHDRIFERFYRVDEGRSRRVGGTGLGLAIVKHLALASGCRVTLDSEVGRGSRFTVHLPAGRP